MNRFSVGLINILKVPCCLQGLLLQVSYLICNRSSPVHGYLCFCSELQRPFGEAKLWTLIWILHEEYHLLCSSGSAPSFCSFIVMLGMVTFKQWLCKIGLVNRKKYSPHLKDWQEPEMAEAVLDFFWQEYIGQEILWRVQHWITSYHSTWLAALILQLESLRRNCWQRVY